jgi:hypothetical protein
MYTACLALWRGSRLFYKQLKHSVGLFKFRKKHKKSEKQINIGTDKSKLERMDVETVQ